MKTSALIHDVSMPIFGVAVVSAEEVLAP